MRSYRAFLRAIPHRRAGYPRVTHPSATRVTPERAPSSDLHVLRTPPAFVLSQDQTRHPSSLQSDRHTLVRTERFTFYLRSRVLRLLFYVCSKVTTSAITKPHSRRLAEALLRGPRTRVYAALLLLTLQLFRCALGGMPTLHWRTCVRRNVDSITWLRSRQGPFPAVLRLCRQIGAARQDRLAQRSHRSQLYPLREVACDRYVRRSATR